MDNVTHTLFALTLARTRIGNAGRGTTAALVLASSAPDIDIVSTVGGSLGYLEWHRGPTHGPVGIVALGLATAGLVSAGRRWLGARRAGRDASPGAAPFRALALVSVVGVAAHVAMDFLTPYGTRVLSPFTWRWAATDWMPIVDVYILAILLAGLVLGWNPKIRRRAAVLALALAAAHCCTRAVMHERALAELPHVFGAALPPPCEPSAGRGTISVWPRDRDPSWRPASGRCLVDAAALPTFTSPFRWRLVVRLADSYEVRELDLAEGWLPTQASSRPQGSATAQHRPDQWTPAVARASETRVARVFLGFSRYPAARVAVDPDGTTTVRWTDIRFDDDRAPQQATRARANLFSATVRIGPDGALLEERLGQ